VTGDIHLFGIDAPARLSVFGTDGYGRDVASRVLHGGRLSLAAGLLATLCSLLVGSLLGTLAGYYGGFVDQTLMRVADLFMALPWLFLLFAVRAALPLHIDTRDTFLLLVGVIGVIGWARPARLVRSIVLSAKERTYVLAARGFGAPARYVISRHVLPQAYGVVLAQAALLIPQFVLAEVTLSFVGLGVGEPTPSWGSMLATLQKYEVLTTYWWMFSPAVALVAVTLGYHLLTAAMHDRVRSVAI
jgi:peptide/nickel transport system permease protein